MRWLRGPLSDCCWFFSGIPIGLALVAVVMNGLMSFSTVEYIAMAFFSAHVVSPFAVAWSHSGYRKVMLSRPRKFVAVPLIVLSLGLAAGFISWWCVDPIKFNVTTLAAQWGGDPSAPFAWLFSPLMWLASVYFVWNVYHFGMQNYGMLRLYRSSMDKAQAMQIAMFVTIMLMLVIPGKYHLPQLFLFTIGAVVINHALTAIGMASYVWSNHHRRHYIYFAATLFAFGGLTALGFSFLQNGLVITEVIAFRAALGLCHFLYDRWIWKLSDPQVRNTIGRDLFRVVG